MEKNDIITIVEDFLKNSANYLVEVSIATGNTIMVEIDNDNGVNIDDCVELNRYIESKLDRDVEDFELTVTSAGLTSPFKTQRQYKKFEGKDVEVLTKKGEKIQGRLKSSDSDGFILETSKKIKLEGAKRKTEVIEDVAFIYTDVKYTKYQIKF